MKKPEELKPGEKRTELICMADVKAKYWAKGDECEYCPKIERINKFWRDCHGPRCRIFMIIDYRIIVEMNDTKELIVCNDTDILPIDRSGY
jgi:hypothetical protein